MSEPKNSNAASRGNNDANKTHDGAESKRNELAPAPLLTEPKNDAGSKTYDRLSASITSATTHFTRKSVNLTKAFCRCRNYKQEEEEEEEEERKRQKWKKGYDAIHGLFTEMKFKSRRFYCHLFSCGYAYLLDASSVLPSIYPLDRLSVRQLVWWSVMIE